MFLIFSSSINTFFRNLKMRLTESDYCYFVQNFPISLLAKDAVNTIFVKKFRDEIVDLGGHKACQFFTSFVSLEHVRIYYNLPSFSTTASSVLFEFTRGTLGTLVDKGVF